MQLQSCQVVEGNIFADSVPLHTYSPRFPGHRATVRR